jgi:hypothetical protein
LAASATISCNLAIASARFLSWLRFDDDDAI